MPAMTIEKLIPDWLSYAPANWKYRAATGAINGAMKTLFKIGIEGEEHLPRTGPAILAANHQSYLDVPLLGTLLRKTKLLYQTYWVIGKNTVRRPVLKHFYASAPVVVINGTVRKAEWVLTHGGFVVIFPEGYWAWQRYKWAKTQRLGSPRRVIGNSAAILSIKTGCPVIPIGIQGTETALPPYGMLPRPGRLGLRVGKPYQWQKSDPEEVSDASIAERSDLIMKMIDALR